MLWQTAYSIKILMQDCISEDRKHKRIPDVEPSNKHYHPFEPLNYNRLKQIAWNQHNIT
jgi:hypothetical protein